MMFTGGAFTSCRSAVLPAGWRCEIGTDESVLLRSKSIAVREIDGCALGRRLSGPPEGGDGRKTLLNHLGVVAHESVREPMCPKPAMDDRWR